MTTAVRVRLLPALFLALAPGLPCPARAGVGMAAALQARIDEAIRTGAAEVVLPKGLVPLEKPLRIQKASRLQIRGEGTLLAPGFSSGTAIQIYGCQQLTLRDFTLDFDPLPFTQGTVTAKDDAARTCDFQVHEGYPSLSEALLVSHLHLFAPSGRSWKTSAPDLYPRRVTILDPRRGRIEFGSRTADYEAVATGDRVVLNRRDGAGMRMDRCENVRLEGLTFLSAPGAAFLARYMKGDNYFRYDVRPGPTPPGATEPRLFSTCADAFNYAYARRGPVLEDCHFSFMGDDSVNLHGFTLLVLRAIGPQEFLVAWPYHRESAEWVVEPGDPARWLRAGNYEAAGQVPLESFTWEPRPEPALQEQIDAFWPRTALGRGAVFRLKLRAPLAAAPGDAIDLPQSSAPDFRISRCEFADHRARGARIMASRGVIEDSVFRRIKQAAITLGPEYVFWRESGWVQDVTLRRNLVEDCGLSPDLLRATSCTLGAISIFARKENGAPASLPLAQDNRRIVIEENTIRGCAGAAIWARAASGLVVERNRISGVNLAPSGAAGAPPGMDLEGPIDVRGVREARVSGNEVR